MHLHNDKRCYLKSNAIYPQLLLNNSRLNVVDVKFEIYGLNELDSYVDNTELHKQFKFYADDVGNQFCVILHAPLCE